MRRILIALGALLVVDVALLFAGPGGEEADTGDAVRVGLVFDVGGRGDKSFNDSAFAGLMRARDELGIAAEYIEPADGSDRESALRSFAKQGFDLVIGTGFIFTDDVTLLAGEYPEVRFACVDFAIKTDDEGNPLPPPPNVAALTFREEQGSFLVGTAAGLLSETRRVGFVGGMDVPLIRRFEAGYRAGVAHVCPECEVVTNFAGVDHKGFKDPTAGKQLGLAQYGSGADIIYHASGSTGLGVFEAARETNRLAIGVDSDQYHDMPGHVLTSMVKRVDNVLFSIITDVVDGSFEGGQHSFGLAEEGVGYVYDDNNRELLPTAVVESVEQIREQIIAGELEVPVELP